MDAIASPHPSGAPGDAPPVLTSPALITVDYIPPPAAIAPLVTTLYHFRCDEPVIRDIQPAAIGNLCCSRTAPGRCTWPMGGAIPTTPWG